MSCENCEKQLEKRRRTQARLENWVDRCAELARKHAQRGCVIERMLEYEEETQQKIEDYIRKDHRQRAQIENLQEENRRISEELASLRKLLEKTQF